MIEIQTKDDRKRHLYKVIKRGKIHELNEPPKLSTLEEIGNSITHGIGALLAIVALILMLVKSDTGLKIMASCFYGISILAMMLMSCLYHGFKSGLRVKRLWRRFDYSSIYLLIGGTFAPLFLVDLGSKTGIILFCIQWTLIIVGITIVCIFGPGRLKWIHFPLYFLLGWSGALFIPSWISTNPMLLKYILVGGLIYTIGMVPFILDKKSAHFIWHFFVLGGAIVHWFGIFFYVY